MMPVNRWEVTWSVHHVTYLTLCNTRGANFEGGGLREGGLGVKLMGKIHYCWCCCYYYYYLIIQLFLKLLLTLGAHAQRGLQ